MYLHAQCLKPNMIASICPKRQFCVQTARRIEQLRKRTILKLSGPDTENYLQNMITNDVRGVQKHPTLYALFLNPSGRVLYDLLLYNIQKNEYLIEYDASAVEYLERHLLMYRLRKDVKIEPLKNMSIWAIYKRYEDNKNPDRSHFNDITSYLNEICGTVLFSEDPRSKYLGMRVVTNSDVNLYESLSQCGCNLLEGDEYQLLRYKIGIGEGVLDHPPGNCLPFETNVDLLNGVSFIKGCYIGQEMTARSNFVLSIRKRLMPIILDQMESYPIFPPECNILNEKEQKMGRLRSHLGQYGLALLKYEESLKSKYLKLQGFDMKLRAIRPTWWPKNLHSDKNEHVFSV